MSVIVPPPKAPLLLLVPFLLLAVLFVGTYGLAMRRVSQLHVEAETIANDMLADVELVSRMQRDLDRTKLLADQHVFETESAALAVLDAKIQQTEDDFDAASSSYEAMPMLPGEEITWLWLKDVVADIRPRLEKILALSRAGDDVAAHLDLVSLEGSFEQASRSLSALIDFNHRQAQENVARIASVQRSSTATMQALAIAGVALSVILGVAMARTIQVRNVRLRRYADRLEANNRDLDAFAGRVAHDLRGPLGTAALAATRLSTQSALPGQLKVVDILCRSLDRMRTIIDDLLAFSRSPGGEDAVSDPAEAAEQLREELAPGLQGKDVSLSIDVHPATIHCGPGLLRQVLWNLADNAMKYRRAEVGLQVEVLGRAIDDRYELSVRDNGVGLSPSDARKVFEPFYRADPGARTTGTGLGLSIVRRVVEANGGSVSVASELGRGSQFVARLPLA
jgi:signal transduction histidine kinase